MEFAELFPMQDSSPTTENIDPTDPIFHNEEAARPYFEMQRWPSGPYCCTADHSVSHRLQASS
jgi:hypothetical protein